MLVDCTARDSNLDAHLDRRGENNDAISATTKLICSADAQHDIGASLGVTTTQPPVATWIDHEYACDYKYANGSMHLSVKQLANRAATDFYFAQLGTTLGRRLKLDGLGQGAFTTLNHSVVVSKDNKVLLVDVTKLPANFGIPADTRADVAISVAATIMGCWTGA